MSDVLIVGASRGLGASLVKKYAAATKGTVYATSRSKPTSEPVKNVRNIPGIDLTSKDAGSDLASILKQYGAQIGAVIITAGYFGTETFDEPKWEDEIKMYVLQAAIVRRGLVRKNSSTLTGQTMSFYCTKPHRTRYTTSAIGPVFVVHHLIKAGVVTKNGKIILVSSESGSITLRHEKEGGGNYAHHASKSALNMVGKLLSLDLKDQGIAVGIVHPGFMRTEMTKGVGFDKYWDDGGAVTPDDAADSLIEWIRTFDIKHTGEYWAPRGPRDIGTADVTLGHNLPTPLQLPW